MISKLDPTNEDPPTRKWSCVWRPDLGSRLYARGSWQQAGGVGGLAWMQTGVPQTVSMFSYTEVSGNGEVHIPMMDHLGNVRHYYQIKTTANSGPTSTVTGQITANLDYDAFGREVRATGPKTPATNPPPGLVANDPWVDTLPFHFSTKFTDRESGLNYYGYRFYDSVDGRWLNRDPLGERGGINLNGMGKNDTVNRVDVLGLLSTLTHPSTAAVATEIGIGVGVGAGMREMREQRRRSEEEKLLDELAEDPSVDVDEVKKWIEDGGTEAERKRRLEKVKNCREISKKYHNIQKIKQKINKRLKDVRGCLNRTPSISLECLLLKEEYKATQKELDHRKQYSKTGCDDVTWNRGPRANHPDQEANLKGRLKNLREEMNRIPCK